MDRELAHAAEGMGRRHPDSASRRLLDLAISLPLAILTVPIVAAVAAGSAWSFRAWPFFVQTRVGRRGRPFRFVKVRSLPADTPDYIDKYALHRHATSAWSDFIRRTHLDELPQLWHVVTGKMSLVGPRPEMLPLAGRFHPEFAATRVETPPGCTGLWQISVTNHMLIGESPQYDLFYLRHATRRLDLWVLWRTVLGLLPGDRRVCFPDVPSRSCGIDPVELERFAALRLPPAWRPRGERETGAAPTTDVDRPHDEAPSPTAAAGGSREPVRSSS